MKCWLIKKHLFRPSWDFIILEWHISAIYGPNMNCPPSVSSTTSYLQGGDDFIAHLLDRNHIAAGLRVDDAFLFLPAYHDGLLTMRRAAHLLFFTLRGQRGVGVGCDHGRDWCKKRKKEYIIFESCGIWGINDFRLIQYVWSPTPSDTSNTHSYIITLHQIHTWNNKGGKYSAI